MKNQAVNISPEPKDLALRPLSFALRHSYCFKALHHLIPKYCKCLLTHWFSTLNIWNDMNSCGACFFFFFDSFYFLILILISQSQKFWSIDLRWLLVMKNCQTSPRDSNMQFRATGTFGLSLESRTASNSFSTLRQTMISNTNLSMSLTYLKAFQVTIQPIGCPMAQTPDQK